MQDLSPADGVEQERVSEQLKAGWAWPLNSRKAHYFGEDRRSLCGKWMFSGALPPDDGQPSPLYEEAKRGEERVRLEGAASATLGTLAPLIEMLQKAVPEPVVVPADQDQPKELSSSNMIYEHAITPFPGQPCRPKNHTTPKPFGLSPRSEKYSAAHSWNDWRKTMVNMLVDRESVHMVRCASCGHWKPAKAGFVAGPRSRAQCWDCWMVSA